MDFTISRVVEMFEERFGKRATTALVGTIAFAVFSVSVKTVIDTAIVPIASTVRDIFSGNKIDAYHILYMERNYFVNDTIGLLFIIIGYWYFHNVRSRAKNLLNNLKEITSEIRYFQKSSRIESECILNEVKKLLKDVNGIHKIGQDAAILPLNLSVRGQEPSEPPERM